MLTVLYEQFPTSMTCSAQAGRQVGEAFDYPEAAWNEQSLDPRVLGPDFVSLRNIGSIEVRLPYSP